MKDDNETHHTMKGNGDGHETELAVQLYKMEYEHCVSSYQNIYEELWKIFSYLSAISAGLLVFGNQQFSIAVTISLSMVPLLFWVLGVYVPLDRYGNMRLKRLAEIEKHLNQECGVKLGHFVTLEGKNAWRVWDQNFGFGWRVRHAVGVFGLLVFALLAGGLVYAGSTGRWLKTKGEERVQTEVQIKTPVQVELKGHMVVPTPSKVPSGSRSK